MTISSSRWDRYLGITAPMIQVPTATVVPRNVLVDKDGDMYVIDAEIAKITCRRNVPKRI